MTVGSSEIIGTKFCVEASNLVISFIWLETAK